MKPRVWMDSLLQQIEPIKEVTDNSNLNEGELWLFSIPSEVCLLLYSQ